MNEEYVQEPVTEVTENTDAQAVEDIEEGIELTDTTTEEVEKEDVKTYNEEDLERLVNDRVNEILPTKIEREKRRIEKDYRKRLAKYEETESILSAGLGKTDIDEINKDMRNFYREQGIDIPAYIQPKYSDDDEKALGELEASKVISLGFEEMQDEANRLAEIGSDNMTVREKAMFSKLAGELTNQKNRKELAKLGVKEDVLEDLNFRQFSSQFNSSVPIKDIYEMYTKVTGNKKPVEQIGSMKNTKETVKKDYYTNEEISKMSLEEVRKNWDVIRKSMTNPR